MKEIERIANVLAIGLLEILWGAVMGWCTIKGIAPNCSFIKQTLISIALWWGVPAFLMTYIIIGDAVQRSDRPEALIAECWQALKNLWRLPLVWPKALLDFGWKNWQA